MSLPIKTQPSVISFSSTCPDITITDYGSSTDSVPYVPTVSPRSPRFFDFLWTAAMKRTEQVQPMNKKEQPKPKATIEVEDKLPSTPIVVTWTIKALHLVYCCGIIFTISQLQSRIITDVSTLLSLLIGLPLVVDNLRYSGFLTSPSIAMYASKLCFFAHEVLTPLGLLYIPLIFVNYIPYHEARSWLFPVVLMVSVFFVYLGWLRYLAMDGWKMTTVNGIQVCRPNHTSHAALIPIFMQVIGIILCSGYVCYNEQYRGRQPVLILFISQMIVFFGNGAVGPNKLLMAMFGNAFEVLWLWSLVQATH